ncbi:MAG: PqqD family protein [Lachnospiraceae bacterium]|nr:PqqD family protein [Lachnospiraceae bacterium]
MEMDKKIKLTKDINVTELDGEKVMVDFETGKYFIIKGCGNDIWDMLGNEISPNEIIDKLLSEYDVSREECTQSVMDFLGKMEEYNFI